MKKLILFLTALLCLFTDSSALKIGRFPAENLPTHDNSMVYEAEDASKTGKIKTARNKNCSGGYCLFGLYNEEDSIDFSISVETDGLYSLHFSTAGIAGDKSNFVLIDGKNIGKISSKDSVFSESSISGISLTEGSHIISLKAEWGYICVDKLTVEEFTPADSSIYEINSSLTNKNSTAETAQLYDYLKSIYGQYTLSGQYADGGINSDEFKAIFEETGKYPAILGLDMMNYVPVRQSHGMVGNAVEIAKEFNEKGGIVTFCWHWCTDDKYLKGEIGADGAPSWWRSFYTENTTLDIEKIMNGEDEEGLAILGKDIEAVAQQLKELEKAGIPVLWRPLHEPSGAWFWWGAKGAEPYKKLWVYLYDKLTNTYECNNLIWVFNDNDSEWYPGDEYVDIISVDIYPEKHDYTPHNDDFIKAYNITSDKPIALAENGTLYDVDTAAEANYNYLFFATWQGEFVAKDDKYNPEYTETEMLKKIYASDRVLTLDEIQNR